MLKKVSSFYMCSICLRKLLVKLKEMKKNVKQKAVSRQDSIGIVSLNQVLLSIVLFYLKE